MYHLLIPLLLNRLYSFSIISELKKSVQHSDWTSSSLYNILEAWLLSTPPLLSRQVTWRAVGERIFHLFGIHHSKSKIFERVDNFTMTAVILGPNILSRTRVKDS